MHKLHKTEALLLFLTILLLPTQLGKHFWPSSSFIYSLPIDYYAPVIYFWDFLVVGLFLVFFLQNKKVNKTALNLFLLFILTQTASIIFSLNIGAGFVRLEQYFIAGLFGVYIASVSAKMKKIIFWGLVISVVAESILAIAQFSFGRTLGFWIFGERSFTLSTPGIAKFDFHGMQFLRPYATFPHPNVLAGFLLVVAMLIQALSVNSQTTIKKIVYFFASFVTVLTVSRVVIASGAIWAMILLKNKYRLILLIVIAILMPVLYARFSSVLTFDNLALTRREELSSVALTLFSKSPIFGIGLNNFISSAADLLLVGPSRFLQPVHNIFLLSLSETGILGLLGFLFLIGFPIWKRSYIAIWVVVIILGMFDHYFLTLPQGYRLLFLLWGISLTAPARIN